MKNTWSGILCRLLIVLVAWAPFQVAHAGMIGTGTGIAATAATALERPALLSMLERADVARELQAYGIDPQVARERVAALSDEELRTLAGRIGEAPAGGSVLVVIIVFLFGFAIWLLLHGPQKGAAVAK